MSKRSISLSTDGDISLPAKYVCVESNDAQPTRSSKLEPFTTTLADLNDDCLSCVAMWMLPDDRISFRQTCRRHRDLTDPIYTQELFHQTGKMNWLKHGQKMILTHIKERKETDSFMMLDHFIQFIYNICPNKLSESSVPVALLTLSNFWLEVIEIPIQHNDIRTFRHLFSYDWMGQYKDDILILAAKHGHLEILKIIIGNPKNRIYICGAFMKAARHGHTACLKHLYELHISEQQRSSYAEALLEYQFLPAAKNVMDFYDMLIYQIIEDGKEIAFQNNQLERYEEFVVCYEELKQYI